MTRNLTYPHLLPNDIPIWERWLKLHADEYTHFDYDVRVGEGRDPGADFDKNIRQMAVELSQRRIDAIAYKAGSITIIEITPAIGLRAIGQVETYPILYQRTFSPRLPIDTLIVAERIKTDIAVILGQRGIIFEIV